MWIILTGYTLLVAVSAFFFIPGLPEVIDVISRKENIDARNEQLNDKASGIYNAFYSFGSITAPIIGGALTDAIGFRSACDINGFVCLAFFFIYAVTNTRPKDYKWKPVVQVKKEGVEVE